MGRLPVPWSQVFEPVDFMIRQSVQEICNIGLGIEVAELCGLNNGHDGCSVFSTTVRPGFAVARTRVGIAVFFQHVMDARFEACI